MNVPIIQSGHLISPWYIPFFVSWSINGMNQLLNFPFFEIQYQIVQIRLYRSDF